MRLSNFALLILTIPFLGCLNLEKSADKKAIFFAKSMFETNYCLLQLRILLKHNASNPDISAKSEECLRRIEMMENLTARATFLDAKTKSYYRSYLEGMKALAHSTKLAADLNALQKQPSQKQKIHFYYELQGTYEEVRKARENLEKSKADMPELCEKTQCEELIETLADIESAMGQLLGENTTSTSLGGTHG